jgi:hypothetical protein
MTRSFVAAHQVRPTLLPAPSWGSGERPLVRQPMRELPDLYDDLDEDPTQPQADLGQHLLGLAEREEPTREMPEEVLTRLRYVSVDDLR